MPEMRNGDIPHNINGQRNKPNPKTHFDEIMCPFWLSRLMAENSIWIRQK
jgi:hypothetical protein